MQSWIKSNDYTSAIEELVVACRALPKIKIEKPIDIKAEPLLLEISFFDMHWGVNDYKYYYDTLRKTLAVIQSRKWERVAIQIGQDLFHNDDFRIDYAIENAEQVTIMHTPGNHDETISWAFNQMIKAQYGDAIEIDDTLDDYKLIHWRECFIGITHGEKVKGKAETLRGIYTSFYPIEFANSKVRALHVGHLHHYSGKDLFGLDMRQLPTRAKEDEWHIKNGYVGTHKRFEIFIWEQGELHGTLYV